MNNSEAKKTILEADSCFCKHGAYKDCHSGCKYREALDAAVEALEQEPTTKNDLGVDLVSRKEMIKQCQEWRNHEFVKMTNPYYYLEKRLNNLPSVTPQEPRWIPVSEKLPEPFTFVNATCRSLVDDRENWVVETIYSPIPKEANKYDYSDWGNIPMLNWGEAEVIAWVERIIPQPYKAEVEPQESEDKG